MKRNDDGERLKEPKEPWLDSQMLNGLCQIRFPMCIWRCLHPRYTYSMNNVNSILTTFLLNVFSSPQSMSPISDSSSYHQNISPPLIHQHRLPSIKSRNQRNSTPPPNPSRYLHSKLHSRRNNHVHPDPRRNHHGKHKNNRLLRRNRRQHKFLSHPCPPSRLPRRRSRAHSLKTHIPTPKPRSQPKHPRFPTPHRPR